MDYISWVTHAEKVQLERLKKMTPTEKLRVLADLQHTARELKLAGLRLQHPDWTDARLRQKLRQIFLYATE